MKKWLLPLLFIFLLVGCNGAGEPSSEEGSDMFSLPSEETVTGTSNPTDGEDYAMGGTDLEAMWLPGNTTPPTFTLKEGIEASSFEIHFWTTWDKEVHLNEIAISHETVALDPQGSQLSRMVTHSSLISSPFHSLFDHDFETGRVEKAVESSPFIVTFSSSVPIKLKTISIKGFEWSEEHFDAMKVFAKVNGELKEIYFANYLFNDFYKFWTGGVSVDFAMASPSCPEGKIPLPNGECTLKPNICNEVAMQFNGTSKHPCIVKVDGREVNCTGADNQTQCLNQFGAQLCSTYSGFLEPGPNLVEVQFDESQIHQAICHGIIRSNSAR